MIDMRNTLCAIREIYLVCKREITKLVHISTENNYGCFRVFQAKDKTDNKTEIAIPPYTNSIAPIVSNTVKARHSMHCHTHQLCKSCDAVVYIGRESNNTAWRKYNILLHEPIETTAAELATSKVILRNIRILLMRVIGQHDDFFPARKHTSGIVDDFPNALMN